MALPPVSLKLMRTKPVCPSVRPNWWSSNDYFVNVTSCGRRQSLTDSVTDVNREGVGLQKKYRESVYKCESAWPGGKALGW